MKRRFVFLPIVLCSLIALAQAQDRMTPEILWSLKRVSDPQVSPDGKWVLFTVNAPSIEQNRGNSDLYLVPLAGGTPRKLTTSNAADYNGRWSPDGRLIAFLSTRDGSPQIYLIDPWGGEARKVSDIPEGVSNLAWSPDGAFFSFTTDVKAGETLHEKYPDLPKANARLYESLPVRHWDTWEDEKRSHLHIMRVDGTDLRDLMLGEPYDTPLKPFGGGTQIAWSPDGKEIAYTAKKVFDFAVSTNSDIYIVPAKGGPAKNITEGMDGFDRDPLYSPDGRWIAFHSMERAGHEADRNRLMLYDRRTGEIIELSRTLDQWVGTMVWAPDSKSLYFSAEDKATVQIYRISVPDGSWKILTTGWYNHDGGLCITPDGKSLVYGRRNFNRPTELFAHPLAGGVPRALTDMNGDVFAKIAPAMIRERWVTSTDGKKVHCWVVLPPDFDSTKRYPMITYCQGGPQSTISQFFSYAWNFLLMASNGYVILLPNRRGLPGFGQEWNDAISKDWGGMPMQDILAAHDAMVKEPYIDGKRCAAIGASAGGYAVFWLAGNHDGRFSAFVSHCGIFNLESMYGSTEELWFVNWENGGPYWDPAAKPIYDRHSPHRYAQNWDTPILIITGEKDFRVPYTQSLEAFTVAQVKGIPSKLLIYPDENHWVLKPQEQILWFREFFEFLGTYCAR
ncbi:MAG: S9 family peptidase [Bacteroidota bacterium]|nr:S9 family peptidase [Bacteroidota bacterium]